MFNQIIVKRNYNTNAMPETVFVIASASRSSFSSKPSDGGFSRFIPFFHFLVDSGGERFFCGA